MTKILTCAHNLLVTFYPCRLQLWFLHATRLASRIIGSLEMVLCQCTVLHTIVFQEVVTESLRCSLDKNTLLVLYFIHWFFRNLIVSFQNKLIMLVHVLSQNKTSAIYLLWQRKLKKVKNRYWVPIVKIILIASEGTEPYFSHFFVLFFFD